MIRSISIFISLTVVSLILVCQVSAKINDENIMGAWLFDEGTGDIAHDASPNGFDGEIVGPKWEPDGVFGSCLEFSGVAGDNHVDCGEDDKLDYMGEGEFSIVTWVKVLTNDNDWHNLVSKKVGYNNSDPGWMAWLDFRDAGAMSLRVNDGTSVNDDPISYAPDKTLKGAVQDGEWHHLAWVITEPGEFIYYFDGENKGDGTFSWTGSTDNDVTLRIGNSQGNSKGLHCLMDEVGVFNITLSEEQIEDLISNGIDLSVSSEGKLASAWGEVKK